MNVRTIGYWVATALLLFIIVSGGAAELMGRKDNVDGIVRLGYPVYFVTLIGVWKLLAAVALVVPRFPRLKEWAYAGIVFNMSGAAVSHAASGDAAWHVVATLCFAALALASWALRPPGRVLGTILPVKG
jgi:uncharacterized membrane protein YphA (DoxX/SURF4 family)